MAPPVAQAQSDRPTGRGGLRAQTPSRPCRFISREILTIREAVWLTDNTYKYVNFLTGPTADILK